MENLSLIDRLTDIVLELIMLQEKDVSAQLSLYEKTKELKDYIRSLKESAFD